LGTLASLIEQTRSRAVVAVLDCCHSGAIARGEKYGLQIKGDGKVIMASSDYFEPSYESPSLGHGHFTHCFIQGLGGGAASNSGYVTVTGLHDYICEEISKLSSIKQTPVLKLTMAGQFVLNVVEPKQQVKTTHRLDSNTCESENRNSINLFSHEEQIVIKALSLDYLASLHINTTRVLGDSGLSIYIKGSIERVRIDFNLSVTKREFVKWVEIVDGLTTKGFLQSAQYGSGKRYTLTHNGFLAADSIDEVVLDNVPSMLDVDIDIDALSENEKTMLKAISVCDDGRIICMKDIISSSERIETITGEYEFANGMDARQTALWEDVINTLVQGEMLVSLMGGRGKRYFKITNKGYTVASKINKNVLHVFIKNELES